MKKIFLALALTTSVALATQAQVYVQGGLNLANITKTKDGQTEKNNLLPSFNARILGRMELVDMFRPETDVFLTGKGYKGEN